MSASLRATLKVLEESALKPGHSEHHWEAAGISGERMKAIIDDEYEPLIKAAKEISRRLADPELSVTYLEEDALNKALAHIEGARHHD